MWHANTDQRLVAWYRLRESIQSLSVTDTLAEINCWWFNAPWQPYYLHWDDLETWPDPWQLLSDNVYCEVARGLGILYTITLLNRADLDSASLVLTESGHNLVLVEKTKYILNWDSDTIVNTNHEVAVHRQLTQQQIHKKYN
jgi:hypothetical protein